MYDFSDMDAWGAVIILNQLILNNGESYTRDGFTEEEFRYIKIKAFSIAIKKLLEDVTDIEDGLRRTFITDGKRLEQFLVFKGSDYLSDTNRVKVI